GSFWTKRNGLASVQAWRLGWARRLHHTSSSKPKTQSGCPNARAISRSRHFFFARSVDRARDPVFRPLPTGVKPLEGSADAFITQHTLRDALLIAYLSRQAQRPHPGGLAIEARRLMQEMLEAVTGRGVQHGLGSLWPIRLLRQALHAPCMKGVEDVT